MCTHDNHVFADENSDWIHAHRTTRKTRKQTTFSDAFQHRISVIIVCDDTLNAR